MPDSGLDFPRLAPSRVTRRVLGYLLRPVSASRGVLMVTRADLFPPDHGAAVKVDRTAWALSRLEVPVYLVTDDRRHYYRYIDGEREVVRYPRWLAKIGPARRWMRYRLKRLGVPAQDAFLYFALRDWSLLLRAAYVAARYGVRVFQAEFPAYARVCLWVRSFLGGCALLVEHNVEFERLRDQVEGLTPGGYAYLRQVEINLCKRVDCVVTVSHRDRDTLMRQGVDGSRVLVIPHGVDVSSFDKAEVSADLRRRCGVAPGRPLLVYHGTYLYPPNLEAVRILATEILPRLRARGDHAIVLAIGPHPPERRIHPDVVFSGSVDNVAPYIKAADIAVVPLQQGGGTRMKVLDYFAAVVPVVSTSKGVEGLGLEDGNQLLIRDGYDEFAAAVSRLIRNEKHARVLAVAGRRFVEHFDWLSIARSYVDLYGRVATCPGDAVRYAASPRGDKT